MGGSSLQEYRSFSYSIADAYNANGYKLSPKYWKIRIHFTNIGILEVKTVVQVSKSNEHFERVSVRHPM